MGEPGSCKAGLGPASAEEIKVQKQVFGKCCNFKKGDGGSSERNWSEVSGSQIEQLVDEPILLANIIVAEPPRLPLPDHVHSLVSRNRSPCCSELDRPEGGAGIGERLRRRGVGTI